MSEKQKSIFTLLYLKKIQTRNQVLWSGKTSCYCTSFCIIILRNTYFTLSCKSRRAADEIFNFVGTSCQRPMGYELSPQLCGFATTKRKMKTLVNNQSTSENARVASGSIAQMCEKPFSWKQSIKNWLKTTKNGGKIGFCLFKMDSKNSEKTMFFGISVKAEFGIFGDKCSSNTATKELKGFLQRALLILLVLLFPVFPWTPRFPLYELLKFS